MRQPPVTPTDGTHDVQSVTADLRLRGRALVLARAGWILTAVAILGLGALAIPVAWHLAHTRCAASPCPLHQITPVQLGQLHALGLSLDMYATYVVALDGISTLVFAGLAAVIFWRRSDDRMALFAAFMLLTFSGAAFGSAAALPIAQPAWSLPVNLISITGQVTFYTYFCIFPNGHFVPRWMRWPALTWAFIQVLPVLPDTRLNMLAQNPWLFIGFLGLVVFAQAYRYRRTSTYVERQQTKWVVLGFTMSIGAFIALLLIGNVILTADARDTVTGALFADTALTLLLWLVPISIGLAVLLSGLWDINVIIRRTLIYGVLTTLLAVVYFTSVVLLQSVFARISGQRSNAAAIVISTLAIAALFQPLRTRIQNTIDRRFYRRKYDAAQMLATFGATLRTETDLNALTEQLLTVIQEAVHPAHVSLWLRARGSAAESRTGPPPVNRSVD